VFENKYIIRAVVTILSACVFLVTGIVPEKPVLAKQKVIYLTFDDGPGAVYTPKILNVLRREHVHATFFVLGYRCQQMPLIVRQIKNEGHEIGSHGYDHRNLINKPESVIRSEIRMADSAIAQVLGQKPLYYRPPYGSIERREISNIRRMGHPVVFWTVDSLDWKAQSALTIIQNVERIAGPGSIVLFHDGTAQSRLTAQALPAIIRYYRDMSLRTLKSKIFHPLFIIY
jgi:peptidoglycan-N-acetylglucosamine deacetylase